MNNEITIKLHDDGKLLSVVSKGKFKLNLEDNLPEVYVPQWTLDYMNIPEEYCIGGKRYPEKAFERVKELNKPWPQEGDTFYRISYTGEIMEREYEEADDSHQEARRFGNFFQTKEEAQMYSLRIESLSKLNFTKLSEIQFKQFIAVSLNLGEFQEWYDSYGHAWLVLLNDKK